MSTFAVCSSANAQEITFSDFGSFTLTLDNITLDDLEFDGPIQSGSGIHEVTLADALVLEIEGVRHFDVLATIIQVSGEGFLTLDGIETTEADKRIPFTLQAAYANRGTNSIGDARPIAIASNAGTRRFPILARLEQPPGPPPPPTTANFNQATVNEKAFIYLYGTIDVGFVAAGTYSGSLQITVEYQ
ncbi:MAG: hypothetical protein ACNA78_02985 [Balneolaceae bacterium]